TSSTYNAEAQTDGTKSTNLKELHRRHRVAVALFLFMSLFNLSAPRRPRRQHRGRRPRTTRRRRRTAPSPPT
ncbi:MAG: hypothetical protein AAF419_04440, partial [Pseudomonadota bacterium]